VRLPGLRLIAALSFVAALVFPPTAVAADLVLQDVDTAGYPKVSLDLALTADLVPEEGQPDFQVLENGLEVEDLKTRSAAEDRPPIDVVLLFDTSGSMKGKPLTRAKAAANAFVSEMGAQDRVAVVSFSSDPRTVVAFSSDVGTLTKGIESLSAEGETALNDGIIQAAKTFEGAENDRYIIVLSDGGDTTSINTSDAVLEAVKEAQAPVYAVALASPDYDPAPLELLAVSSGGRFLSAKDVNSIAGIFQEIAQELRNLYNLEFTSAKPSTKDLEIEVRVANGDAEGRLVTAVPNPLYEAGALPAADLEGPSPANLAVLSVIALVVALTVGLAVYAVGMMIAPEPNTLSQLRYYEQSDVAAVEEDRASVRGSRGRVMSAVAQVAERRGFTGLVRLNLERAGLPLRANEYIFLHLLLTTIAGLVTQLLTGRFALSALVVALVVIAPIVALRMRVSKRRSAFEEQLPDVLSLLAGSLRAGWGIQQAIELVVEEIAEPASSEFRRVQSEARFGLPLEQALGRMAERLDSEDFRWTVSAISIQREVGGNLAEVLDIVASTIRQRAELRRHVSSLTAESRFSAVVLSVLPIFILVALLFINPVYASVLFGTTAGQAAIIAGALLLLVGIIWVSRLTKVEV
jgi:tight adherence protein B